MIKARPLPFSRWWLRPLVYTLVSLLLAGGGYGTQLVQGKAREAAARAETEIGKLATYMEAANQYHTLALAIASAKALGIDTTAAEAAAAEIRASLARGDIMLAESSIATQLTTLTQTISAVQSDQASALEEAKKYGILNLSITNGAGASVTTIMGDAQTTNIADDFGIANLRLPIGTYTVTIAKSGYQTLTIPDVIITSLGTTAQNPALVVLPASTATPRPSSTPRPTATPTPPASSSTAHSSYRRTTVSSSRGTYTVDIMEFDLGPGKIKVVADTAADEDCTNNCPVLSVKGYADRWAGAVAAINGTYFCPSDYSSCAGQVNSFFWKIRNPRLGFTINQHNGLGENDPFMTFDSSGTGTYCSHWSDCRTPYTGINHKPAVVTNGSYSVDEGSLDDKQRTAKISRAAIGLTGQHLTVAVVQSATIMDLGAVMVALGTTNALNLDAGGSSGMWYNGAYRRGPGRSVPNALVFIEQ